MIDRIPKSKDIIHLIGEPLYNLWQELNNIISEKYDMDTIWNSGGKKWVYEYKYRRGGKTLCSLYIKEDCIGFMVILGKDERLKFEADRENYSFLTQKIYDETETYRDGKWLMFEPKDFLMFNDYINLLEIKRKPNKI